jgi:hypothetical protein
MVFIVSCLWEIVNTGLELVFIRKCGKIGKNKRRVVRG